MAYGRGRRPAVGLLLGLVMAANLFATLEGQGYLAVEVKSLVVNVCAS